MTSGARACISPAALSHNLDVARQRAAGCRVMAAVKGNGYGHGLVTAAQAFAAADALAVARLVEARALRAAGIAAPLTWLSGPASADERREAAELDCDVVVHSPAQLPLFADGPPVAVWIKVDTGMHRLGFAPADVPGVIERLRQCGAVSDLRLMTHLACAEHPDDRLNTAQLDAFRALVHGFDGAVSLSNSAMLFRQDGRELSGLGWGHAGATWVRPGIALYGVSPFPDSSGQDLGLRPAMTFEARLIAVKQLEAGERVGYGGGWQAKRATTLGIIAAGYGDGYPRHLPSGTPVLVNERRVPLAGIVSMDLAAIDLGPGARDRVGDRVLLWGAGLPVEDVARVAGTSPYPLVTGVTHRESPAIAD